MAASTRTERPIASGDGPRPSTPSWSRNNTSGARPWACCIVLAGRGRGSGLREALAAERAAVCRPPSRFHSPGRTRRRQRLPQSPMIKAPDRSETSRRMPRLLPGLTDLGPFSMNPARTGGSPLRGTSGEVGASLVSSNMARPAPSARLSKNDVGDVSQVNHVRPGQRLATGRLR